MPLRVPREILADEPERLEGLRAVGGRLEGYFYARMEKSNARRIIAAIEAQTGVSVEEIEE